MKKVKLTILILSFLCWCIPVFGRPDTTRISISKVKIFGNRQFSQKEIQKMIPPGRYTREQLKSAIDNLLGKYQQAGFWFAHIELSDSTKRFMLKINEGEPLYLGQIGLTCSDSVLLTALEDNLDIRHREQLSETINENVEKLLQYLENNGYPFAEIVVDSLKIRHAAARNENIVDCYLSVLPGAFVKIDSIHVAGNELTRYEVIVRETRLGQGEIYSHQKVLRVRDRLMKTGFFNHVDEPQIYVDGHGKGHLVINVKEGNPNQMNAVFGYNPGATKNDKGYITGLIDVAFKNLLGTGRLVEAFWRKKDQRSQELKFRYVEPWVGGYPVNMGMGFQQTIQDTSFVRRNFGLTIDFPFSDILTIHSVIGKETVLPDSIGQLLYQLPKSSSYLVKVGFTYDSRDNLWNPSRGVFYGTEYEYGHKKIISVPENNDDRVVQKGNYRRDRWMMDAEIYVPTLKWQTILIGLHGRQVKSNEGYISVADLYRLGGTGSLRGYREDEFLGEKIAWLNLEYRYLLAARSRVFVFLDGGYFMQRDRDLSIFDDYKFSYGFGMRIETRLGIIGIDYGLGEGRGLTSGLVHIGLMNKF